MCARVGCNPRVELFASMPRLSYPIPPRRLPARHSFEWMTKVMDADPLAEYQMQLRCMAAHQTGVKDLLQYSARVKPTVMKDSKSQVAKPSRSKFQSRYNLQISTRKNAQTTPRNSAQMSTINPVQEFRRGPTIIRQIGKQMADFGSLSVVGTGTDMLPCVAMCNRRPTLHQ